MRQVTDWWKKAEAEIWGDRPDTTPGQAIVGRMADVMGRGLEAGAEFWEDPSPEAAWGVGKTALEAALKTPGAIVAGAKAAPGMAGRVFTAFDQATRGVTGAIAGAFDVLDVGLMEQGILGAGAEIIAPMIRGERFDFTPQEFEAGRARYTRWWTAISQGQEASQELYDLTLQRIREGAQPEDIDADSVLSNPIAELAGRLVLDPTNLIPASWGKKMRMMMSKESAAKLFATEDLMDYGRVWDAEKALGAANAAKGPRGLFYKLLHPFRQDNAALSGKMAERAVLTLGQALEGATDPGDVGRVINSFILAGGEDEAALLARQFLKEQFGALPVSKAGKQTTGLLREMITDKKGKLDFGIVEGWLKEAKSDEDAVRNMLAGLDGAMQRVYPVGKPNKIRQAQNTYRKFLSQYLYMGWNPSYAFRNAASNTAMQFTAGYRPFEGAGAVQDFAQRWGGAPFTLRKGYGGPGGELVSLEVQSALADLGKPYEAVRLKDLPEGVIKHLAKKGIKGAPAMKLSEAFETAAGERIIHQALETFWKEHWRPRLPDEVRRLFPTRLQADSFERMVADAVNVGEMDGALGASRLGRSLGDEWEEVLGRFPGELRREVLRARLEADDAADFARRMDDIGARADDWLVRTTDDLGVEIAQNDELVKAAVDADHRLIEDIDDPDLAEEISGYLKNDEWEKQLAIDRGNDMAMGEYLRRHSKASDDPAIKDAITDLITDHQLAGPETTKFVDVARARAWAESWATTSMPERSRIWNDYFDYRDRMWRKYWDDFTRKGEDFLQAGPPPRPRAPAPEAAAAPPTPTPTPPPAAAVAPPTPPPAPARAGPRTTTAFGVTDPNEVYDFEFEIVDLDNLITSHDEALRPVAEYPAEMQARVRDRAASRQQVDRMASTLNADALLSDTRQLDKGSPIIGADLVVESGNGRTIALRQAREANPERWQQYVEQLTSRLQEWGLSPEDLEGIGSPVLVRRRLTEVDRVAFAAEANRRTTMAMSLVEQARQAGRQIDPEVLARLEVGETTTIEQSLRSSRNRSFVESVLQKLPANERAGLVDAKGVINRQGVEYVKSAVFAHVYGESDAARRVMQAFTESIDPVIVNVEKAMFASLPGMARAESLIRSGQRAADLSIADDFVAAVNKLHDLKSSGARVDHYLAQMTFLEEELTELQKALLAFINENGRSQKVIRQTLRDYARRVVESPDVRQATMFEQVLPAKGELLDAAIASTKPDAGPLFAGIEEAGEAARPPVAPPREGLAPAVEPGRRAAVEEVGRVEPEVRRPVEEVAGAEPIPDIGPGLGRIVETPEFQALREEMTERLTPTRFAVASISNRDTQDVLGQLADAASGWNWDDLPPLDGDSLAGVRAWMDGELIPRFHETKAIAGKAALNERDFVLYNYTDRRHFDNALSYLYPYAYWYTRTAVNVPRMLMYNPKVLAAYLDYKEFVRQLNDEAQGLPWWEQQLRVPGTDYYFNLEATLNPLYSLMTDFHDPEKTTTPAGQWLERLNNLGPSLDVAFWALYAAWRAREGEPEEALASMGYLGQPTKAFRYATGLLGIAGGKGITLEPWLWDEPFSFQGLDKWERRRVGHHLYQLVQEGGITQEQAWDAGYRQNGPEWDEAVARMTAERGPGIFASLLGGVGLKPRKGYEVQVDKAIHAERDFYTHAAEHYDMGTDEGVELYRQAQRRLYEYYPFLGYVKLVRRGELDRDQTYTWEVLRRIPPGSIGFQAKQAVGLDDPTVDKFYQTMGDFEGWADMDRANFMAKIQALGAALGVPDTVRVREWDDARQLYYQVKDSLRAQYGEDIFEVQSTYFDVRDVAGADAARVILEANPQLEAFWQARSEYIANSDALMSYWGSVEMLERMANGFLNDETERRWPGYEETQAGYFQNTKDTKAGRAARRQYLKENPWLKDVWDFRDVVREELAQVVQQMTDEMIPPLGPVLRPDADLTSVLVQRLQEVLQARYATGEWVQGRLEGEGLPGELGVQAQPGPLDIAPVSMVESGKSLIPLRDQHGGRAPTEVSAPSSISKRTPSTTFSWQTVKGLLGRDLSEKLVGILYQGREPTGDLRSRLVEIYEEHPLGLVEFGEWLDFLRLMWRASISGRSSGRLTGVSGVAKRPRPFYGTSRAGAGRRYVPW